MGELGLYHGLVGGIVVGLALGVAVAWIVQSAKARRRVAHTREAYQAEVAAFNGRLDVCNINAARLETELAGLESASADLEASLEKERHRANETQARLDDIRRRLADTFDGLSPGASGDDGAQ